MIESTRYGQIIEAVFFHHYQEGITDFLFERTEFESNAHALNLRLPKNLGDILYSFRYRRALPASILATAPTGYEWVIRAAGRSQYQFILLPITNIVPTPLLVEIKIPDSTPELVELYALGDEQSVLTKIRYNRLVDIFTGITCYSLQNHLRTTVEGLGQIETDELYVGVDSLGRHYIIPIQVKSVRDKVGLVQIEQDFALCALKFPQLICLPVAAQPLATGVIVMWSFVSTDQGVAISAERHYRLVRGDELSAEELKQYQQRPI